MIEISIWLEKVYDYFCFDRHKSVKGYKVKIDKEIYEKYQKIMEDFHDMQKELEVLFRKEYLKKKEIENE